MCYFISFTKGTKAYRLWDPEKKIVFASRDLVFNEDSMLQVRSKTEDKTQCGTLDSLADSQRDEFQFSDDPIKPFGSDEDSVVSDGDRKESTREQHVQARSLRRPDRVLVPPIRYGWKENQVSFKLVTKVGDPSSFKMAIEVDDSDK